MARLATGAVHLCQRLQEMYPQKLQLAGKQSEQSSPFRRWTTGSGAGSSYRHHDHRNMYSKQISEGSAGSGGGGSGGVARWSLGLEQLLADPAGAAAFAHFLAKEFAGENIRFWWSCEQYRSCSEEEKRSSLAAEIWQRHLAEGAAEAVNVDAGARRAAALRLHHLPPPADLFAQAQKQIFNVMKFDSYPRFLRSGVHAECARADLRGLPPPYLRDPAHQGDNDRDTPTKLKKSASNASERRRSGGSLLPWRLRAASRDRDAHDDAPAVTDVVKSSQNGLGQASLCRLVLPDGATTVVGLDAGVTVRSLVDRLLQRRNLICTTYDVLLKDNQEENRVLDPNSSSTVLAGREAHVERRCVVRVLIAGRAVAVRCRPARRLRHVLRPVLQRYCGTAPGDEQVVRAVLRDNRPLHPDTLVQELDGARLQVVEVAEGPALRLLDERDDTQSVEYMSSSLSSCASDAAYSALAGSTGSLHSAGASAPAQGAPGAAAAGNRVRAALRPGPPLHHHPPEFLDNLRETQRQMLQPRTPPPLPPKPSQRPAPTVV